MLNQCRPGTNDGPLDVELLYIVNLTDDLVKLGLQDGLNTKVNAFIEGANKIRFFSSLKPGTKLTLKNFAVSQNFSQIGQYFPTYITCEGVATFQSNYDFFISFNDPLPQMRISFNQNSLEIGSDTNIDGLNLAGIYETKISPEVLEKVPGEKNSLKWIHEKTVNGNFYVSFYAVIVDCSGSYQPKLGETGDFLVTLKITDPSIFPSHASVNVFHRSPKDFPKIANFGDIIKLQEVYAKDYSGVLQTTVPCNGKNASFFVFPYSGESGVPYISYKGQFHNTNEHSLNVKKLSDWTAATFSYEYPLFIKNTKRLFGACSSEEIDLLTRVLGVFSLGIQEGDPQVCICADSNEISQLVVPEEKKKMLRYIEKGDIIRIRSVCYEDKVLHLNHYSEILKIPAEYKSMSVPLMCNEEEFNKCLQLYLPNPPKKVISYVSDEFKHNPIMPFQNILKVPIGKVIRIEGLIVKLDLGKRLDITVWDGEREENIIRVQVRENFLGEFMNGKPWDNVKKECIGHDKTFQAAIRVENDSLTLISTKLIN